jgi:CRISPR-associated endonuclease/helicase Cas3
VNSPGFEQYFIAATKLEQPFAYQCRLACGDDARLDNPETLTKGRDCVSLLINVPTGLGKTAAVVLAWLWNRVQLPNSKWPRRLVYCLPMRTLVEQTEKNVREWLKKLDLANTVGVHVLMGGEDADDWDIHPERPAILIGTQDMLLSRALNRGYAAGRARWPKDFALLNNDCLWVFDEVQLMSTGFATSLQLQSWRDCSRMKPAIATASWWMSATVEQGWLASAVDFVPSIAGVCNDSDEQTRLLWNEDTKGRSDSARRLKKLLQPDTKTFHREAEAELKVDKEDQYIADVAKAVRKMAEHGGKTLVIMNTVRRACALAEKMKDNNPLLLHSRFRHRERKAWISKVKGANFIIATQVIEAGLDITSRVLFSESCPWPSFIQRCGRAARYPDDPKADVYWLDVTKDSLPYSDDELEEVKGQFKSLTDVSLAGFREHRKKLSPEAAQRLLPYVPRFVPQAKDILDLFDTTPDLTGADIDISRYIRDGEEHDITVFWRDCSTILKGKNPPKAKAWQPEHAELCPVPVFSRDSGFRGFAQKTRGRVWRWDYRDGWTRLGRSDAERIFPGQVFLLERSCGGYDPEKGWTGRAEDCDFDIGPWKQPAVPPPALLNEEDENTAGMGDDFEGANGSSNSGQNGAWRTILHHSREVCEELHASIAVLLPKSDADEDARVVLPLAGRLHDWGKAHAAFRQKVEPDELAKAVAHVPDGLPAKAPNHCWRRDKLCKEPDSTPEAERDARRAGFRHELASGLAVLELLRRHQPNHPALAWPDEELRAGFAFAPSEPLTPLADTALAAEIAALNVKQFNLLIYLVAAHHGKVRLSLRSSPDDLREDVPWPCPPETPQARGVREGDSLPDVALPGFDFTSSQILAPAVTLHLDVMDLGLSSAYGPSWRERTGTLLATHGPFRLAWYEAILRVADQRASKRAEDNPATT